MENNIMEQIKQYTPQRKQLLQAANEFEELQVGGVVKVGDYCLIAADDSVAVERYHQLIREEKVKPLGSLTRPKDGKVFIYYLA